MKYEVKYQLQRAQDALRTALKYGAETENPHLLRHIAESLSEIDSWLFTFTDFSKESNDDTITFNIPTQPPIAYYTDTITGNISISTENVGDQVKYTFS